MDPPPPPLPPPPFFQHPIAPITSAAVSSAAATQILPPPPLPPHTADVASAAAAHNHIAHAANATAPALSQSLNHPPYTDMICAAITALKEKDGSSKRAIAKYIERVYTGLPATHSALLTHHLKRLKNSGNLVMVKKSYKLPRSDFSTLNDNNNNINNPATTAVANAPATAAVAATNSGLKRGRGRPPKPKSASLTESMPAAGSVTVPVGLSITPQSIVPPPTAAVATTVPNAGGGGVQPQVGAKKRPGRPKKVAGGAPVVMGVKRRGRPPKSGPLGPKKSPGRPKKIKSVASNGVKKVPKRLPKSVVVPYATGAAAVVAPKPRGRPKKGVAVAAGAPASGAVAAGGGGAVAVQGKRPGRPPKVVGGVVNPNKKRAGRPKKNASSPWAATGAYGDLKSKFEYFQSKVRQAVGVLKPQLTNETPVSVVTAIQELEGLASMDINAPIREEAQPQPPPPPAPSSQPQLQLPLIQN